MPCLADRLFRAFFKLIRAEALRSSESHYGGRNSHILGTVNLSAPPLGRERRSGRLTARVIAEIGVASIGTALLIGAILANQRWLDRHFLPSWFLPHHWYVLIESSVRVVMAAVGVSLALVVRPRIGRFVAAAPAFVLRSAIAAALAFGASELVLRRVHLRAAEWLAPEEEPRRRRDARLGW